MDCEQLLRPIAFTSQEIDGAHELRRRFGTHLIDSLCIDSDYFLARWWRSFDGDIERIERQLFEYILNRRLLAMDVDDLIGSMSNPTSIFNYTLQHFSCSYCDGRQVSNDVCVFIQKMRGVDLKQILKVMPTSYILQTYMALHELFVRAIHKRELETNRPSAMVVILDLDGIVLGDYVNPMSVSSKLARLVVKIWQDYFSENVLKLFIINPPGIVSIMWQIAKCLLDAKSQSRIHFIGDIADLTTYLDIESIPIIYGGKYRDDSGFSQPPESCTNRPKHIEPIDYFDPNLIWTQNGIIKPPTNYRTIKSKQTFIVYRKANKGDKLVWQYIVNGDVEFDVIRVDGNKECVVWPRMTLMTLRSPEQGLIICDHPAEYRLRFTNPYSTWFALKLEYTVCQLEK